MTIKKKMQSSSLSKDQNPHQRGEHEEIMAGPCTEANNVYEKGGHEEMEAMLIPGQDLDLGSKPFLV